MVVASSWTERAGHEESVLTGYGASVWEDENHPGVGGWYSVNVLNAKELYTLSG